MEILTMQWIKKFRDYKTHYFSEDEWTRIIENENRLHRKLAFQVGFDTGARAGEMLKIRIDHFDANKNELILYDSKKRGWKTVPISDKTINMLQMFLGIIKKNKGRLFKIKTTNTLNNWLHERCDLEDIKPEPDTRIRWHSWRGTFIRKHKDMDTKWLMQVTGDSHQTIMNYYSELTNEDMRRLKDEHEKRHTNK